MLQKNDASVQPQLYEILAIGTPIFDQIVSVSDEYIQSLPGARGGTESVDYSTLRSILESAAQDPLIAAGGSAANTLKGLAKLGHLCALFGKIGNDIIGFQFREHIEAHGVVSHLVTADHPTAQAACLITPDQERTMRTFLGAGKEMKAQDLKREMFQRVKLVHIEGYLLDREALVQKAMELAKEEGAKVSFDVSSFEIAGRYKKKIVDLASHFIDILFANEEETLTLTGLPPKEGCEILKDISEIAVVKMGERGCWVGSEDNKIYQPAYRVKAVDTTGAGDLFASGFLHGYLRQKDLVECARYGALVASYVVQVSGAEINPGVWETIKEQL